MKIGAVINNASGTLSPQNAKNRLEEIKRNLEQRVSPECLTIVSGHLIKKEIERVLNEGIDLLVIGGGDGTVSTAAQYLFGTDIPLLILALGTRNNFARDAGIPLEYNEAIQLLDKMNMEQVDLGEVNGHIFINNTSLGLYPNIVKERETKTRRFGWSKWRAHIMAIFIALKRLPRMWVKIEAGKVRHRQFTPLLFIGNNEYGGISNSNFSRASLNGGRLWLCMAQTSGIITLLRMAWQITLKGVGETEYLETMLLTELTVKPWKRKIRAAIDGENYKLTTPLRFKIHMKSLRLVIP